ncbi:MAG TPA: hypothetical protein VLI90_16650, partial [Tepidisphaeraceae bacterium]|nr:hypothetical protein [Tepidisphaeraceae bacterium]
NRLAEASQAGQACARSNAGAKTSGRLLAGRLQEKRERRSSSHFQLLFLFRGLRSTAIGVSRITASHAGALLRFRIITLAMAC